MITRRVSSAIPYYAAGLSWLLYACIFSLYRWYDFLIISAISILLYFLVKQIFPGRETEVEVPVDTGNQELDAVILQGREAIIQMRQLKEGIQKEAIRARIDEMEAVSGKIFDYIKKEPGKAASVRTFMSYYLPTGIKLLKTYQELEQQGSSGENISGTLHKIEEVMESVVGAFHKELDGLFAGTALDIEVEAKTLDMMMDRHGLKL